MNKIGLRGNSNYCGADKLFTAKKSCKIQHSCQDLKQKKFELDLSITLVDADDSAKQFQLKLERDMLLLEPYIFQNKNHSDEVACYLAISSDDQSYQPTNNDWVLGSVVMRHYLTVFDSAGQDDVIE